LEVAVALSASEREELIDRYAKGPERLRTAFARVPEEARHCRGASSRSDRGARSVICTTPTGRRNLTPA
jgi:hypothetical protein